VEAGGGGGDGSALAGVDGLIAVAIGGGVGAGDVGRERDVADFFHASEEVAHRSEADAALAEFAAGDDLGLELVVIPKEKMLADSDFAAWADQTLPFIRIALQLPCEQDLDPAAKKVARGGILRAERLGPKACAASVKTSGKYACVIEDKEIAGTEEIRKVAELDIGQGAGCGGQV
jgi:hypothetical protein